MTCPHCGKQHEDAAQFCPETGKPIAPAAAPLAVTGGTKGVGKLLEEAFALYKANFVPLAITVGVVLLPLGLVSGALRVGMARSAVDSGFTERANRLDANNREYQRRSEALQKKISEGTDAERESAQRELAALSTRAANENLAAGREMLGQAGGMLARILGYLLLALLIIPLQALGNFLAQAAVIPIVGDRALGGTMDPQRAWQVTLKRLVPLIITSIIASIAVGVGLLLCVIPGVILGFLFVLASPVVMLEGKSGIDALKRSSELVRRHWVDVLLVMIVYAAISIVLSIVFGAIGGYVGMFLGELARVAAFPLPIIMTVLLYLDLRRVDEGRSEAELHRQMAGSV